MRTGPASAGTKPPAGPGQGSSMGQRQQHSGRLPRVRQVTEPHTQGWPWGLRDQSPRPGSRLWSSVTLCSSGEGPHLGASVSSLRWSQEQFLPMTMEQTSLWTEQNRNTSSHGSRGQQSGVKGWGPAASRFWDGQRSSISAPYVAAPRVSVPRCHCVQTPLFS